MLSIGRLVPRTSNLARVQCNRKLSANQPSVASDPVQRLFVDKIKEFKTTKKGLDEAHEKAMVDEMARLKRVYRVDDESKLTQFEYKYSNEYNVSLHDIDENKEFRQQIASGEYQKQLTAQPQPKSALLSSIPEQVTHDLHLPPLNKPDPAMILENDGVMPPAELLDPEPDYKFIGDKQTPERLQREMNVMFGPEMPTVDDDKSPQRDLVNFPRLKQPLDTPPTRFHFIPESWFQFFYPKTGVTGPYVFAGAFTTFLLSKEWLVWEHELLTGVTSTIIFTWAVIKFGPMISGFTRKELQKECDDWENWRVGNVKTLTKMQEHYRNEIKKTDLINDLYEIRKQDVDIQLEGEYRNRVKAIYDDTKRRLNYLVSVADSQRQIAHKNMVNWVISNAISSIGQKQEAEVLDNCIRDLKLLSNKHANVI